MMGILVDFDHGGKRDYGIPSHLLRQFRIWKSRMTAQEIQDVKSELHRILASGEVHTTSWIPGANWGGTPYDPIYWKATKQHHVEAAKCFGLFAWECVHERCADDDEDWGYKHCEKDGYPIKGRTYFRLKYRTVTI